MAYMTLHADTFGEAEIIKTSDDGNVSGITFTVVNNGTGESQTVTTGADGKILLKKPKPGTYSRKDMHLFDFACGGVQKKLRLVAHPINVHSLPGDSLHRHANRRLPEVFARKARYSS